MESVMNINYEYYRIFHAVAKHKSFTGAAGALMSSQPNITRTIKNLENELGCTLFVRSRHGVELTPEGERLYAHVQVAVEHLETAEEELALEKTLQSGVISIGASEVALHCFLLPVLKEFRTQHPGVRLRIANHNTPQALTALKNGLVDLAVVTSPPEKNAALRIQRVKPIQERAVCSAQYPIRQSNSLSLAELSAYPLIALGPQTMSYDFYADFFASHGLPFAPEIEAATSDQILTMVKSDLGVGFVPTDFIEDDPDVRVLALREQIPLRYVCLVKQRGRTLSVAAKALERLISEQAIPGSGA